MEATASVAASNELLTLPQLKEKLSLPEAWLRKRTNDGTLPALRIGNAIFYNLEAVKSAMLAAASQPSPKTAPRRPRKDAPAAAVA